MGRLSLPLPPMGEFPHGTHRTDRTPLHAGRMARPLRTPAPAGHQRHRTGARSGAARGAPHGAGHAVPGDHGGGHQWQRIDLRHAGGHLQRGGLPHRGLHLATPGALPGALPHRAGNGGPRGAAAGVCRGGAGPPGRRRVGGHRGGGAHLLRIHHAGHSAHPLQKRHRCGDPGGRPGRAAGRGEHRRSGLRRDHQHRARPHGPAGAGP